MPLASVLGLFSNDLAIDLGTANTLVYVGGRKLKRCRGGIFYGSGQSACARLDC